jgi:hypothetical protein
MKKLFLMMLTILSAQFVQSQTAKQVVNVTSNITASATWTADKIYVLSGIVRIQNGVTLTVEPGTVVKGGKAPDQSNATCLLVDKGGKLVAIGTKEKPIVFTSGEPKGQRDYGDWGGIVIFGNAKANKVNPTYEGGVIPGNYGGSDDTDNSGTLKYCRIEFAGFPFEQDRELNSLTMCAVGNGTTIDYVQCSFNNDDAFEWFGGAVNAKHLVAFKTNDDDFDVDQGFRGNVQFGVSLADPNVADVSTKNGFEVDNDAGGTNETPKTAAVFSNMTVIGAFKDTSDVRASLHGRGAHLRRNNEISIFNSVIMGWREGVRMDGATTFNNFRTNVGFLQNNIVAGNKTYFSGQGGVVTADFTAFYDSTGNNNRRYALNSSVMLKDAFNYSNPDFRPMAGSPALSGASFANAKLNNTNFTATSYIGAFGETDNWMAGWTNFDPNNAQYDSIPPNPGSVSNFAVLNLNVYPNPTNGTVQVDFDLTDNQMVNMEISDLSGRTVYAIMNNEEFFMGSNRVVADLTSLNNGLYLVKISTSNGVSTHKIFLNK